MKLRPEDLLQAALEAAARGQEIDGILAGLSGEEAADLRALISAATAAASLGRSDVPPEAARRSRLRLLRRVAAMPPTVTTRPRLLGSDASLLGGGPGGSCRSRAWPGRSQ